MKTRILSLKTFIKTRHKPSFSEEKEKNILTAKRTKRKFFLKHLWLYPLCACMVYFLSGGFLESPFLRILFSPILSFPLFSSLVQLLYRKRNTYIRSQCKVLFQSLCTFVSGGYSLESAFLASRSSVESVFGKKCILAQSLRRLEKERAAQLPFSESLIQLCYQMDYMEIYPIMQALSITRVIGNGVISILRSSCQMITELISVNNEVDANNAGKNAEALLLCLMPYGITFTLSAFTGDYMIAARQTPTGTLLMLSAFSVSVFSCGLLLRLIGDTKRVTSSIRSKREWCIPFSTKITKKIQHILFQILPESFLSREYERALEMSCIYPDYLPIKIKKALSILLMGTPFFLWIIKEMNLPFFLFFIVVPFLLFLFQVSEKQKVQKRREAIMEDIPLFLAILTTLLQSGILLSKAIYICSGAFSSSTILNDEILWMKKQLSSGISAAKVIEDFSARTPIPEAQAALLLAARFERKGGLEIVQLLELQASSCWSLCKNVSRKRKEREATQMLLPMMLDLLSVLLVVMTPAILSFNKII